MKTRGFIRIDDNHALIKMDDERTVAYVKINPAKTWPASGDALKKRLKYVKTQEGDKHL